MTTGGASRNSIFEYQDFRDYLRSFFAQAKSSRNGPTRKQIATELGISLSNLSMILSGQRKLARDLIPRMGRAIGLEASEQRYFEALVSRAQAQSADAVVDSLQRMNGIKKF